MLTCLSWAGAEPGGDRGPGRRTHWESLLAPAPSAPLVAWPLASSAARHCIDPCRDRHLTGHRRSAAAAGPERGAQLRAGTSRVLPQRAPDTWLPTAAARSAVPRGFRRADGLGQPRGDPR